ncbi:spidroin-1-like [Iris pallida]|uniref:Spidroin-1-like n=1 Tax=Iris pallida TaxID=29817 RepID=A0AAX6HD69_IRIPA|nr:spidroin-1-like [Iris pallida]
MDSRTFRELFCGLEIMFVVLELFGGFRWIIWVGIICRYLSAHFPVLGLSRNRGSAAQIFTNYISNRLSKMISKTDFRATTVPVCGPRRNANAPVRPDVEA